MSDEPPKENPITPEPQKPSPSIWDTFNQNRTTEPRDISAEVRTEAKKQDKVGDFEPKTPEQLQKKLTDEFVAIYQNARPKDEDNVTFQNDDLEIYLVGDDARIWPVPEGHFPEKLSLQQKSLSGSLDENKRMHEKWFRGKRIPEFFKLGNYVVRIMNDYEFSIGNGSISREEQFIVLATSSVLRFNHDYDRSKLIEFKADYLNREFGVEIEQDKFEKRIPENNGWPEIENGVNIQNKLEAGDYEQLQAILTGIKDGRLLKVIPSEDEDDPPRMEPYMNS